MAYQSPTQHPDYSQQPGLIVNNWHAPPPPEKEISTYNKHQWGPPYAAYHEERGERMICGLRAVTFGLIIAIIVLVIAGGIGGGVGGSIAVQNAKTQCLQQAAASGLFASSVSTAPPTTTSSTSTSTSTSTSIAASSTSSASSSTAAAAAATTAWGPLQTTFPYTGCPGNNDTVYTTTTDKNSRFKIVCGLDIPFTPASDLLYAITPTFELCMEACASWNKQGKANGGAKTTCAGVAFLPTHVNGDGGGQPIDCVLKSYATGLIVNPNYIVDSAILLM